MNLKLARNENGITIAKTTRLFLSLSRGLSRVFFQGWAPLGGVTRYHSTSYCCWYLRTTFPTPALKTRVTAVPGWPILETDNDLSSKATSGREVRVAGSRYTLRRAGTEIQVITLAADESVSSDFWQLSLVHSGLSGETDCLPYDATAEDVNEAVESLAAVDSGGVVVTRRGTGIHGDPYTHSIYFEGDTTAGDINEIVVNTTACIASAGVEPNNSVAYVTTVQQGGRVERQTLTLATEAGYILGDYFRLAYNVSSSTAGEDDSFAATDCLEWGAPEADIAGALSALPALGEISLSSDMLSLNTTGMDIFPSTNVQLSDGMFVDGRLKRGDVLHVAGSYGGDDSEYIIESVSADGVSITFESSYRAASGTGGQAVSNVTRVISDSVVVARSGTGKSVTEIQRVVLTAPSEVTPLEGQGFFRLQWAHDGQEEMTDCLEFGAEASTVQEALDALGYDLDGSGTSLEEGDQGHIIVTREGDATSSSGYGYEYKFEFRGIAGVSTVVGNVEQLEVSHGLNVRRSKNRQTERRI